MNWDAVAAIAEGLGAVGVIVTLVYLASQIRQSERATLASIQHSSIMNGFQLNLAIADASMAELLVKASQESADLSPIERFRMTSILRAVFAWYEDIFSQTRRGVVDVEFWQNHGANLMEFLRQPGIREWWRREQGFFGERFRDEVNRQLAARQGAAADEPQRGPVDR